MATWHTPTTAAAQWRDAPTVPDELAELLEAAQDEVLNYGDPDRIVVNDEDDTVTIPAGWRIAQLALAKEMRKISRDPTASGDTIGLDEIAVRSPAFAAGIRQRIRPRRGTPGVG